HRDEAGVPCRTSHGRNRCRGAGQKHRPPVSISISGNSSPSNDDLLSGNSKKKTNPEYAEIREGEEASVREGGLEREREDRMRETD
ncbi:hypothetical protein, partial [Methanoculleus sp.]|uniref:hypothetical protein n=1 Tax=Methanoculleus sp. TaxID=90427 RepID=UPI00272DD469